MTFTTYVFREAKRFVCPVCGKAYDYEIDRGHDYPKEGKTPPCGISLNLGRLPYCCMQNAAEDLGYGGYYE